MEVGIIAHNKTILKITYKCKVDITNNNKIIKQHSEKETVTTCINRNRGAKNYENSTNATRMQRDNARLFNNLNLIPDLNNPCLRSCPISNHVTPILLRLTSNTVTANLSHFLTSAEPSQSRFPYLVGDGEPFMPLLKSDVQGKIHTSAHSVIADFIVICQ